MYTGGQSRSSSWASPSPKSPPVPQGRNRAMINSAYSGAYYNRIDILEDSPRSSLEDFGREESYAGTAVYPRTNTREG